MGRAWYVSLFRGRVFNRHNIYPISARDKMRNSARDRRQKFLKKKNVFKLQPKKGELL